MAGQRRLAISRLRVPNLDGFVATTAGNLFSIGTPRHRVDTEIVRSQDANQQQQRGENLGEKNLEKAKQSECPVPSTRKNYIFKSSNFVSMFEHAYPKKGLLFEWPVSLELRQAKD